MFSIQYACYQRERAIFHLCDVWLGDKVSSHLHMLSERRRMGVGLVATLDLAVIGLVRRMHVHMLLSIAAVGESPIAALMGAVERLLA